MSVMKICLRSGRAVCSFFRGLFRGSKSATKAAKANAPIPVGKPAVKADEAEPKGFFEMLAELNENKAYQEYKEVYNQGIPFDHYLYMH